jgi:hypothetical protein
MRWAALFDDLEAQLQRDSRAELEAEVAERVRHERAQVALADRLLASSGRRLGLRLRGDVRLSGTCADVAPAWLVLDDGHASVLVPMSVVVAVDDLGIAVAPEPGPVLRRLGLGHALRALARDRTGVSLWTDAGVLAGTIDRVGADHLDLAEHPPGEPRRAAAVRGVVAVAFSGLLAVRSPG